MNFKDSFFEPTAGMEDFNSPIYRNSDFTTDVIKSLSNQAKKPFYVIDYYQQRFDFIPSNVHFLCGYNAEDVINHSIDFLERAIPFDDLKLMCNFNKKWIEFLCELPIERRSYCYLSFDIRMIHFEGCILMVNHQIHPFHFSPDGKIMTAVCFIKASENKHSGNAMIEMTDSHEIYLHSIKTGCFNLHKVPPLTPREEQIKELFELGLKNKTIAQLIRVEVDTVKFHRKSINRKLGVWNEG